MSSTRNYKILIVDDSKFFSNSIKNIVSKKYDVVGVALSGQEALEKLISLSPDVVLLDVTMPNMDGRECLEKILNLNPETIVLMISALQDDNLKEECLKLGAKIFINKDQIKLVDASDRFLISSIEAALDEAVLDEKNTRKTG